MALPRGVMGLSAVCDFGIYLSYPLPIYHLEKFPCIASITCILLPLLNEYTPLIIGWLICFALFYQLDLQ